MGTDVAKRRRQGLVACRAALPCEGLLDARPGLALAPTSFVLVVAVLLDVAMDVQADRPHPTPPEQGEQVGKRHRRIRARSASGQVAGAATEKHGLEALTPSSDRIPCHANATAPTDVDVSVRRLRYARRRAQVGDRRWAFVKKHPRAPERR